MGLLDELLSLFLPPPKQYGKLSVTIHGEEVKSHAEQKIADYLSRNGIRYEYERPIEVGIWIFNEELCKPDFYLPDYDVYIEYWGMKDVEDGYKRRDYRANMAWKMKQYERYDIKLISIYPDNLKNLDWVFRKRFTEVTGKELPRTGGSYEPRVIAEDCTQAHNNSSDESRPICPVCGSKMVLRRARHGTNVGKQFWGCSQWPTTKCRGIISI
ncbi:MAG: hypothetical protein RMM51_05990 [Verrucomicrobiae bacterium]|nr:hypothetical protein [Verrucomicrobiae bacterium]